MTYGHMGLEWIIPKLYHIILYYTILYRIKYHISIYIISYKYIYILLYYILYTHIHIHNYLVSGIFWIFIYMESWNPLVHLVFFFFRTPNRSAGFSVNRRTTTWWSTMAGGRLTATASLWLLGDAHDGITSQLSMGKIHGFSWDFMGFIRIYHGIPSGHLTVVCWWFYPLVMTNIRKWENPEKNKWRLMSLGKSSISMGHLYHGYVK